MAAETFTYKGPFVGLKKSYCYMAVKSRILFHERILDFNAMYFPGKGPAAEADSLASFVYAQQVGDKKEPNAFSRNPAGECGRCFPVPYLTEGAARKKRAAFLASDLKG